MGSANVAPVTVYVTEVNPSQTSLGPVVIVPGSGLAPETSIKTTFVVGTFRHSPEDSRRLKYLLEVGTVVKLIVCKVVDAPGLPSIAPPAGAKGPPTLADDSH